MAQLIDLLSVARARADLKAPVTLLLVAVLAVSAGCTAKVSYESTTAAQAEFEPTAPAATMERHRWGRLSSKE
jgi:hypothetical protein